MKVGVATSVVAHAALLVLAVAGLSAATPLEPEVVESIAVELVPITDVTNIRMGSLDSTVVETETPAVADTETPAELAQPTGNTAEDQPTPQETPTPTPAPVVNTAPEPVPDPAPEPEPAPVQETPPPAPAPAPAAEPEPAPVEEAPPVEVAAVAPAEAVPERTVAPMPAMRPAQLMRAPTPKQPVETKVAEAKPPAKTPARTETPAKTEAPKPAKTETPAKTEAPKPAPKAETPKPPARKAADPAAKPADRVADLINSEASRGGTTGQGGQATLGRNDGRSSTLTQSQLDGLVAQIKTCLNVPAGAADAGITAQLMFSIDGGGNVRGTPQVVSGGGSQLERALASAAQRAVMRCGPYQMAASQDVKATFDPRELF
jgi:colicin import membrane protein